MPSGKCLLFRRVAHPFQAHEVGAPSFRSLIAEGWETTKLNRHFDLEFSSPWPEVSSGIRSAALPQDAGKRTAINPPFAKNAKDGAPKFLRREKGGPPASLVPSARVGCRISLIPEPTHLLSISRGPARERLRFPPLRHKKSQGWGTHCFEVGEEVKKRRVGPPARMYFMTGDE